VAPEVFVFPQQLWIRYGFIVATLRRGSDVPLQNWQNDNTSTILPTRLSPSAYRMY
jgi:hypothetical protein